MCNTADTLISTASARSRQITPKLFVCTTVSDKKQKKSETNKCSILEPATILMDIIQRTMARCPAAGTPAIGLRAPIVRGRPQNKCRQCRCAAARADVRMVNADLWSFIGPFHRLRVLMSSGSSDPHLLSLLREADVREAR